MGQFRVERKPAFLRNSQEVYIIKLSDRYDLEKEILEDIVIHEMIHFLIYFEHRHDSSSHGKVFRSLMQDINRHFNRNITISHRCTEKQLRSDNSPTHSIICLCTMTDGRRLMCRVSQSRIFEINKAILDWDVVEKAEWYWVYGDHFNRYRKVLTPKLFAVDKEGISLIESGTRLEFVEESGGRVILRAAGATRR